MSRIIARVPIKVELIPYESATCIKCHCGFNIREGEKRSEENRKYIGKPCECGGTYLLERGNHKHVHGGYTLVECDCGEEIQCYHATNECPQCGEEYSAIGEKLIRRDMWEHDEEYYIMYGAEIEEW